MLYVYNSYGQLITRVFKNREVSNYYFLVEESMFINSRIIDQLESLNLIEIPELLKSEIENCKIKEFRADQKILEKYFESPFSDIFLNNDYNSTFVNLKTAIDKLNNKGNVVTTPYGAALLIEYAAKKKISLTNIDSKINLSRISQIYVDSKYKDQMPYLIINLLKIFLHICKNTLTTKEVNEIHSLVEKLDILDNTDINEVESVFIELFNDKEILSEISQLIQEKFFSLNDNKIKSTNIYFKLIEMLHSFSKTIQKNNQYYLVDNHIVISPTEIKELETQRYDSFLKNLVVTNNKQLTSQNPALSEIKNIIAPETFALNQDKLKIALLIDCDNASYKAIEGVINELSKYGVVNIRKAYGNWTDSKLGGWQQKLHEYSLIPVQQFDYTKGKNATDIAMSIDAMEMLYTNDIKAFAFMTSDSDFTPLIMKLLSSGMTVFGFGEQKTPLPFVHACSRFIFTENLSKDKSSINAHSITERKDLNREATLLRLLDTAIEQTSNENGWSNVAAIGLYLNNKGSFSPLNYGYQKLGQMLRDIDSYEIYMDNLTMNVSKKDVFF